ncbi:carbamoyl-phosphate synthase L chain ATP-binding protein [Alcanivorax xiamenensis]|uniref:acetyl-CoA carboxylase n=1 Tax=Alcanivorax xiamenensis TaxID=1177156 RepID=A0ABQ6Y6Y3_9GAMM|nr:carboxyl transferase domain-containing protein [Alcanivorax xiamenensis]KAF0805156.1 carbamoyl-phosphate synthase L chain ATP-binding protein [Alcanivorax xiamenensis]
MAETKDQGAISVLVANRGEIAVRIIRAIHEMGGRAVAVFPEDDKDALHVHRADEAVVLAGTGVAAYLNASALIEAALSSGCGAIHPGYGFLSENADFAHRCAEAGVVFIGPSADTLAMLGDKARARAFAMEQGVAVMPGTTGATTLAEAEAFASEHGAVMIKALSGGGGRGMRAVTDRAELPAAFERCRSEAAQAFGDDALYVERLARNPRHIEIQVVGDGVSVQHLGERDCSIQRRHQKLIEIAPSPALEADQRDRIVAAALQLARALNYRGLGTFEFLVDGDEVFFMEANPRLQVEHTVTEQVTGVNLVATQLRIANGARLPDIGLAEPPLPRGFAVQARVNLETLDVDGSPRPGSGVIHGFALPSGPGLRVDTYGYAGYRVSPRYDSLIAKVIGHGDDFVTAARRTAAALAEFGIEGVPTNLDLVHGIVTEPDFVRGRFDTGYLDQNLPALLSHRRPGRGAPVAAIGQERRDILHPQVPDGACSVRSTLGGVLLKMDVAPGDVVPAGAPLLVVEAMKMEHVIRATESMRIDGVVAAAGDFVDEGDVLVYGSPVEHSGAPVAETVVEDWSAEVAEIVRRRQLAEAMGGEAKVERQRVAGKLTARERVTALADPDSFREIGALTGFVDYVDGRAERILPANFVAGTATVEGRKIVLGVDDFTVRGGSGDAAIHDKQIYAERYAREMRLPVVRLLDGASGGGSVKTARENGFTYIPVNPAWDAVVDNLSLVPVVAACLGPTVGLGAARLVMSHLAVMVEGLGQLFTAGPPVVRGGTGEDLTKEELGGADIHRGTGSVERIVPDEATAFAVIRTFLGYLPGSAFELPPVVSSLDPAARQESALLSAIPRNPRHPYAIGPILEAIFDAGSVFTYAEYGDGIVTALARLDGHPVGVIASDPMRGATMSVEGAQAVGRLVDLCETFHLPIVSLTDQAGMTIGSVAERRATIRAGARAIAAVYQARVPQAEIILRRVYGVGGAGIINRHRASRSWSWPSGDWGSLPVQGGIEAAFRAQIEASDDPAATIAEIAAELKAVSSPFRTAEHFGAQDLIDPRDSRALLCDWVRDAYRLLPEQVGPPSFGARP